MTDRITTNGKIVLVMLGYEDTGIFTCMVHIEGDGSGQGFGGYTLDGYSEEKKRRIGTAYGMEWILCLMNVLEVADFKKLEGQCIRVDASRDKVYRVGHIIKNKWFDPEEVSNAKN